MEITNSEDHQKYLTILKAGKISQYFPIINDRYNRYINHYQPLSTHDIPIVNHH